MQEEEVQRKRKLCLCRFCVALTILARCCELTLGLMSNKGTTVIPSNHGHLLLFVAMFDKQPIATNENISHSSIVNDLINIRLNPSACGTLFRDNRSSHHEWPRCQQSSSRLQCPLRYFNVHSTIALFHPRNIGILRSCFPSDWRYISIHNHFQLFGCVRMSSYMML